MNESICMKGGVPQHNYDPCLCSAEKVERRPITVSGKRARSCVMYSAG